MPHIGFKQAKESGLVVKGAQVLSYPDHKGERRQGVILEINEPTNEIAVSYKDYGRATLKLNGRLSSDSVDTSLDINLILIEE